VELDINVLALVVMHRILHQREGGFVVYNELGRSGFTFDKLS
jgi:hypothetical protein